MAQSKAVAYSRRESAALLGVGVATVDRRVADGTLRSVKVGGRRLIPADAISELLNGGPTAESVAAERAAQGLPPTVVDPDALNGVDAAIGSRRRDLTRAS